MVEIISQSDDLWSVRKSFVWEYFSNFNDLTSFLDILKLKFKSTIDIPYAWSKDESPWIRDLSLHDRDDLVIEMSVKSLQFMLFHLSQEFNNDADGSMSML